MKQDIYVIAEHDVGCVTNVTYEMLTCARILANDAPSEIHMIILGKGIASAAEQLAGEMGLHVICIEGDVLESYTSEGYRKVLTEVLAGVPSALVLIPHTSRGSDYASGLAVHLQASCVTAVQGISHTGGKFVFRRSYAWGKLEASVASNAQVVIVTVMPGAFACEKHPVMSQGTVSFRKTEISLIGTKSCRIIKSDPGNLDLHDAEVIVGVGLGIESEESLALIRDLAGLFRKSAIGGSRAACDRGWLEYQAQIGLTGKTVSPRLYIACGISGSMQHMAGIKGARSIVAINKDRQAAIFRHADVGIVEDLKTFIPLFITSLRQADPK
jgi:electron transfer flavoprotein alpha subunit